MFKYILILIFFVLISNSKAEIKEKIIKNLQNVENLKFKFEQNINGKIENGNCTIEYPKKIYCKYDLGNQKILVSNGKSLVIKTLWGFLWSHFLEPFFEAMQADWAFFPVLRC